VVHASVLVTAEGIFRDKIPAFIEGVLEGRFFKKGFALEDAASIAAVLEELVLDVPDKVLDGAPTYQKSLTRSELEAMLDGYLLQWLLSDDPNAHSLTQQEAEEIVPKWQTIKDFARGEIDRLMHAQRQAGYGNAFRFNTFTVADFKEIVKSITIGFGPWWEQECQAIKKTLISIEHGRTGRIPLSAFYRTSVDGEWRFSESEAYLRELGALDESSVKDGPQVILPNYLLGTSNCIGTSTYYHVCCLNECEALLGELEQVVKGPVATPKTVFEAVINTTEEEDRGRFFEQLEQQLHRIAKVHRGKIPLHGRLFGQWMHHAFPRECPFPHRAGSIQAKAPLEFGDEYLVTEEEISRHVKVAQKRQGRADASLVDNVWDAELEVDDEELLTDIVEVRSSGIWGNALSALSGGTAPVLAGAAVFFLLAITLQDRLDGAKIGPTPFSQQKVFV
jgi:hypothetical protein